MSLGLCNWRKHVCWTAVQKWQWWQQKLENRKYECQILHLRCVMEVRYLLLLHRAIHAVHLYFLCAQFFSSLLPYYYRTTNMELHPKRGGQGREAVREPGRLTWRLWAKPPFHYQTQLYDPISCWGTQWSGQMKSHIMSSCLVEQLSLRVDQGLKE